MYSDFCFTIGDALLFTRAISELKQEEIIINTEAEIACMSLQELKEQVKRSMKHTCYSSSVTTKARKWT